MPTRVQGPARNTGSSNSSLSVSQSSAPVSGDINVLLFAGNSSTSISIASITQTGVTWSRAAGEGYPFSSLYLDVEIWIGQVGSGASANISLSLNGSGVDVDTIVDVCEYFIHGPAVDVTAFNAGNLTSTGNTGTTVPTAMPSEIWVGGMLAGNVTAAQSSPTNGFTNLDGAVYDTSSLSYLEKIALSTGQATCQTTLGTATYPWVGCIVTIKDQPTFASVSGNAPLYYIPVTLTNSMSSATPTNSQVKVTINSNTNPSDYQSALLNVNWQDGAGNILNSWLESGETNTSTSSVYWVNLGSLTIAASGQLTIYQAIYATSVTAMNGTNTGAEPKYTGTYGQYDNGATVFQGFYDNFSGSSLSSKWTNNISNSGGTLTINNGMSYARPSSGNNYPCIYSTSTFGACMLETNGTIPSGGGGSSYNSAGFGLCNDSNLSNMAAVGFFGGYGYSLFTSNASGYQSSAGANCLSAGTCIWQISIPSSSPTSVSASQNYGSQVTDSGSYMPTLPQSIVFWDQENTGINLGPFNWVRVRVYLSAIPSQTTGSLTAVATYINLSDTGSGSDSISSLTSNVSLSDSGSSSDTQSITNSFTLSDSGSGSDAASVQATMNLSDSGSGSDAIAALQSNIALTELGSGSDSLALQANVPVSDSGSGSESLAINATVPLSDLGSGSDTASVQARTSLPDSGSGSDSLNLQTSTPISISDSGSGSDTLSINATVPLTDSGSGSDNLSIQNNLAVTDSGSGSDSASVQQINPVSLSDSGSSSDSITSIQASVPLTDSTQGSDTLSINGSVLLSDLCSGTESITAGVQVNVSDTGSGNDFSSALSSKVGVSDSSSGSDSLQINANIPLNDSGSGSDTVDIQGSLGVTDSGGGSDSVSIAQINSASLSDSGQGSDSVSSIQGEVGLFDSCLGTDVVNLIVPATVIAVALTLRSGEQTLTLKAAGA